MEHYQRCDFMRTIENAILLHPLSHSDDSFNTEILKDLVSQGIGGDELLTKFAEARKGIKKAVELLIDEADEIASGKRKGATTKDIFGED